MSSVFSPVKNHRNLFIFLEIKDIVYEFSKMSFFVVVVFYRNAYEVSIKGSAITCPEG